MKQFETNPKELYEIPVVLDISPVTVNVTVGESQETLEDEPQAYSDPST